jgi:hypothetical protein
LQAAYETFGCNEGNVFFLGIDKGNSTAAVKEFDSIYGIEYPSVSGQDGGGNAVHWDYNIQATPSVVVITPDKAVAVKQIYPPNTMNVTDSVAATGGTMQSCTTGIDDVAASPGRLKAGPNPSTGAVQLRLDVEERTRYAITVLNHSGQQVATRQAREYSPGTHQESLDLSGNPNGLYFIRLEEQGVVVATKKIILLKD